MRTDNPLPVEPKPKTSSKTLWVAAASALLVFLAAPEVVEELNGVMGVRIAGIALPLIFAALRLFTGQPLQGTPAEAKARHR